MKIGTSSPYVSIEEQLRTEVRHLRTDPEVWKLRSGAL